MISQIFRKYEIKCEICTTKGDNGITVGGHCVGETISLIPAQVVSLSFFILSEKLKWKLLNFWVKKKWVEWFNNSYFKLGFVIIITKVYFHQIAKCRKCITFVCLVFAGKNSRTR